MSRVADDANDFNRPIVAVVGLDACAYSALAGPVAPRSGLVDQRHPSWTARIGRRQIAAVEELQAQTPPVVRCDATIVEDRPLRPLAGGWARPALDERGNVGAGLIQRQLRHGRRGI